MFWLILLVVVIGLALYQVGYAHGREDELSAAFYREEGGESYPTIPIRATTASGTEVHDLVVHQRVRSDRQ